MRSRFYLGAAIGCTMFFNISSAQASCGGAFCPINTQWNTQGVWTESGWRTDLRYEYILQNQPRAGHNAVGIGAISRDHDEIETINNNLLATTDYSFGNGWGVNASLPVINRDHTHIHNDMGAQELENWNFTEIGDVQVTGRYQFDTWNQPYVFGIIAGLKLPTGRFDVANNDGEKAERTLQPGTGTTDALIGGYVRENFLEIHSSVFAQAMVQLPLNERDEYRPGQTYSLDLGYRYDVSQKLSLMMQLNGRYKNRDSGQEAEPEDSGGQSVSLSPGISYGLNKTVQLYGFIQRPLYQYVNGVQLTPDWSVITGISMHY